MTTAHEVNAAAEPVGNNLATAGLVLGIVSTFAASIGIIPTLAIIFSSIGLARASSRGGMGRVKACIGLGLGVLYFFVYMYYAGYLG
jgi:hypothetical protein